jgi:hypothetical protein
MLFVRALLLTPGEFTGWPAIVWTVAEPVSLVSAVLAALLMFLGVRKFGSVPKA